MGSSDRIKDDPKRFITSETTVLWQSFRNVPKSNLTIRERYQAKRVSKKKILQESVRISFYFPPS